MIFILHADHEQNASTSTVRIAASSQANPYACIAAGIACGAAKAQAIAASKGAFPPLASEGRGGVGRGVPPP